MKSILTASRDLRLCPPHPPHLQPAGAGDTRSVQCGVPFDRDMGLPQDYSVSGMDDTKVKNPFPAPTQQVAGEINGVKTDVMYMSFADKIMITISQNGKLGQWVCLPSILPTTRLIWMVKVTVPLLSENPTQSDPYFQTNRSGDDALLPSVRFSPRTLLGAGGTDREAMGQLYASQIANAIVTKSPEESRSLMLGLGLVKVEIDREVFWQVIDLVLSII